MLHNRRQFPAIVPIFAALFILFFQLLQGRNSRTRFIHSHHHSEVFLVDSLSFSLRAEITIKMVLSTGKLFFMVDRKPSVCFDQLMQQPLVIFSDIGGESLPNFLFTFFQFRQISFLFFLLLVALASGGSTMLDLIHLGFVYFVEFFLHVDISHF